VKKTVYEPAKGVGNPDPQGDQKVPGPGETKEAKERDGDATAADATREKPAAAIVDVASLTQQLADKTGEQPFETLARFASEDKFRRKATDEDLPAVERGDDAAMTSPTDEEQAAFIKRTVISATAQVVDAVGGYLTHHKYGGDYKKALLKDPHKDTSLNDLAKLTNPPFSRQKLGECVRAYAVGSEMEGEMGLTRDSLDVYKRVEASRVNDSEKRQKLILKALAEKLTVKEVREEVKKLSGKVVPQDRRLGESLMRQIKAGKLSDDEEARDFLLDKERLRKTLSAKEAWSLIDDTGKLRQKSAADQVFLEQCEDTLEEVLDELLQDKRRQGLAQKMADPVAKH
jgi:hypothetical protein